MNLPSKAGLLDLANTVESARGRFGDVSFQVCLTRAAQALRTMAETRPEAPKKGETMKRPSKAEVDELLWDIQYPKGREIWNARVREVLRWVSGQAEVEQPQVETEGPEEAKEEKPKGPKIETLREAARRLWLQEPDGGQAHHVIADGLALVLRRVDRLEQLILYEFTMSAGTYSALGHERAEMAQMLGRGE